MLDISHQSYTYCIKYECTVKRDNHRDPATAPGAEARSHVLFGVVTQPLSEQLARSQNRLSQEIKVFLVSSRGNG